MTLFLKVKLKSLAAESKIIRDLERRCVGHYRGLLREHRIYPVRAATRNTLLAYGYLRGLTYAQIEGNARTHPNWAEVHRMVMQYGCSQRRYNPKACERCEADFKAWQRRAQGCTDAQVASLAAGDQQRAVEGGPLSCQHGQ